MQVVLHAAGIHSSTIQPEFVEGKDLDDLSRGTSNCADIVCESKSCLTNSCCSVASHKGPEKDVHNVMSPGPIEPVASTSAHGHSHGHSHGSGHV